MSLLEAISPTARELLNHQPDTKMKTQNDIHESSGIRNLRQRTPCAPLMAGFVIVMAAFCMGALAGAAIIFSIFKF